ncbi:hypothetical protein CASFOL_027571 [Castilleja foliolosa]|uniref:CCHC-type domain-containing protein n=1 Tax=Castilleja foliolosa TaxID=1961234 RepID=A0ABD3CID5_9LAMI
MDIESSDSLQHPINEDINAIANINLEEPDTQNAFTSQIHKENETTIIAKIITPKTIKFNAFKSSIIKAWSPKGKTTANHLENNMAAFVFEDQRDTVKILNSTWTFRDHHIAIAHWPPDKSLPEINLGKIKFWIHAIGLPISYTNHDTAKLIGDTIGSFIKADLGSSTSRWKKALRIQIEVDLSQKLHSAISISVNGKNKIIAEIRYERLTEFCFHCGLLGHRITNCDDAIKQIGDRIISDTFGPWLKSENSHIKNPKFVNGSPGKNQKQATPEKEMNKGTLIGGSPEKNSPHAPQTSKSLSPLPVTIAEHANPELAIVTVVEQPKQQLAHVGVQSQKSSDTGSASSDIPQISLDHLQQPAKAGFGPHHPKFPHREIFPYQSAPPHFPTKKSPIGANNLLKNLLLEMVLDTTAEGKSDMEIENNMGFEKGAGTRESLNMGLYPISYLEWALNEKKRNQPEPMDLSLPNSETLFTLYQTNPTQDPAYQINPPKNLLSHSEILTAISHFKKPKLNSTNNPALINPYTDQDRIATMKNANAGIFKPSETANSEKTREIIYSISRESGSL